MWRIMRLFGGLASEEELVENVVVLDEGEHAQKVKVFGGGLGELLKREKGKWLRNGHIFTRINSYFYNLILKLRRLII